MTRTSTRPAPTLRTMDAIVQDRFGAADVLEIATVERPTPGEGEVLLEVHAAGIDRGTEHLMTGLPYLVRLAGYGVTRPRSRVPGFDVAGVVVGVGAGVDRFTLGDEVFGIAAGSFAEYATAAQDTLALKPAGVSFEQAAVAGISGMTALKALTVTSTVQPGQRVLVLGASGGVGTYAVQLAKVFGAHVTGVASTAKLELVRALGADEVIDYTVTDFTDLDGADARYDLILDIGGRSSISRLRRALAAHGTLVIVGGEGGNRVTGGIGRQLRAMVLSRLVDQRLTAVMSTEHYTYLDQLAEHLASGRVVSVVGQRFELADVPEAMRQLASGRSAGKTVVTVRPDAPTG
ncbi:MAG: NAD(P)-dependent alcohol dehydrogenase [Terracoccus sp.]